MNTIGFSAPVSGGVNSTNLNFGMGARRAQPGEKPGPDEEPFEYGGRHYVADAGYTGTSKTTDAQRVRNLEEDLAKASQPGYRPPVKYYNSVPIVHDKARAAENLNDVLRTLASVADQAATES